jgi:hypothetical protein
MGPLGPHGNVREFHTKEMYANKKLLIQHGDMSGTGHGRTGKGD